MSEENSNKTFPKSQTVTFAFLLYLRISEEKLHNIKWSTVVFYGKYKYTYRRKSLNSEKLSVFFENFCQTFVAGGLYVSNGHFTLQTFLMQSVPKREVGCNLVDF